MKKANTLLVVAIILSCQLSYSQVKRQYQDDAYAETTVVIKESTETSDLDVLNNYFDIDDVGVGQVFRLTTEQVSSKSPKNPVPKEEPIAAVEVPKQPDPAPVVVQQMEVPQQQKQQKLVAEVPEAKTERRVRSTGGNYPVKAYSYSGNFSRKRTKKTNRRNTKKRGNKCYSF